MMRQNDADGKYDYNFNLGTRSLQVTEMPVSKDSDATMTLTFRQDQTDSGDYPDSAEALKAVANGSYWEYYEQWKAEKN